MRSVCLWILTAALLAAGCASSEGESYATAGYDFSNLDKVAIVEVTGKVYGDAAKNEIGNMFTMELMKRGYSVVERAEVQALLKEQEFQASDITTNEGAAQAGRVRNVPAVLLINVPKYEDKIELRQYDRGVQPIMGTCIQLKLCRKSIYDHNVSTFFLPGSHRISGHPRCIGCRPE